MCNFSLLGERVKERVKQTSIEAKVVTNVKNA